MDFAPTILDGVLIVDCERHRDSRGFLTESFRRDKFDDAVGEDTNFVQENCSFSRSKYTVRGLHLQSDPRSQGKLVFCTAGEIWDVAVDVRQGSKTFGQSVKVKLSADNGRQLWIPAGLLHGFVTLEANTQVNYKCTDYYAPDFAQHVQWNDPELSIDWGIDPSLAILSDMDRDAQCFQKFISTLGQSSFQVPNRGENK